MHACRSTLEDPTCPYRSGFADDLRDLQTRLDELPCILMKATADVLLQHLDEFRKLRPDYIITDAVAPWGQWVAEALGVPVITSVCTFAVNRHVLAYGLSQGARPKSARSFFTKLRNIGRAVSMRRKIQKTYQLRGPALGHIASGRSGLNLVYTSRLFQPCAESFDASYRFVGPLIGPRIATVRFDWGQVRHPAVVFISLGTIFFHAQQFYRECFSALAEMDCQVVLSAGSAEMVAQLGTPPANFLLAPQVPQLEALQRARVFVSHGGMNSVSESIMHGVPLLVVPRMSEQHVVGMRTQELGAALCIASGVATAANIRECVARLIKEDQFRLAVNRVKESFVSAGGAPAAAEAALAYVQSRR